MGGSPWENSGLFMSFPGNDDLIEEFELPRDLSRGLETIPYKSLMISSPWGGGMTQRTG